MARGASYIERYWKRNPLINSNKRRNNLSAKFRQIPSLGTVYSFYFIPNVFKNLTKVIFADLIK